MSVGEKVGDALNWVSDHVVGSGIRSKGAYNRAIREDTKAMQEGKLGYTQGKKDYLKTGATDEAQRNVKAALDDASETGKLDSGTAIEAAKAAAGEAAKTFKDVEIMSSIEAENRRKETMNALNQKRQEWNDALSTVLTAGGEAAAAAAAGGGTSGAISAALMALCWVAREVLPEQWRDCRTYVLFGAPKWFRNWYVKNGEQAAEWLRAHPWAKVPLKPVFRYFAWRGKEMARRDPSLISAQAGLL